MADLSKHSNRIPQELLGGDEQVSTWQLPRMGEHESVIKSAAREKKSQASQTNESISEFDDESINQKPLTAEELQNIAEQAQQEGYADGFKEGMEKGLKQGEAKGLELGEQKAYNETLAALNDQKQRLAAIADQLYVPMQNQDKEIEKTVVSMVLALTKHLLGSEIAENPDKLLGIINRALSALPVGANNIRVRVSEQDFELLEGIKPFAQRDWQLIPDAQLERGGCRVETDESFIDYACESRIQQYLKDVEEQKNAVDSEQPSADVIAERHGDSAEGA